MNSLDEPITNRVSSSGLITLDLEDLYPKGERLGYDLAQHLWQGLVLREQQLRDELKAVDWTNFQGKHIAIFCSEDAIIPTWAYMLLAIRLEPVATTVFYGTLAALEDYLFEKAIDSLDLSAYKDQKVVVKGCSKVEVPISAYVHVTNRLRPLVQSLMFGEPCSTVPLYKKAKVVV